MSEARHEKMASELRKAAPTAPESLRERVGALREPQPRRTWRLRPALVAAVAIVVAVGVSAATIGGLTGSTASEPEDRCRVCRQLGGNSAQSRFTEQRQLSKGARSFSPPMPYAPPASSPRCLRAPGFSTSTSR